jgi:hypothetical protein
MVSFIPWLPTPQETGLEVLILNTDIEPGANFELSMYDVSECKSTIS